MKIEKITLEQAVKIYRRILNDKASDVDLSRFNQWANKVRCRSAMSEIRRRTYVLDLGAVVQCRGADYFTVEQLEFVSLVYFGHKLMSQGKDAKYKELCDMFKEKQERLGTK